MGVVYNNKNANHTNLYLQGYVYSNKSNRIQKDKDLKDSTRYLLEQVQKSPAENLITLYKRRLNNLNTTKKISGTVGSLFDIDNESLIDAFNKSAIELDTKIPEYIKQFSTNLTNMPTTSKLLEDIKSQNFTSSEMKIFLNNFQKAVELVTSKEVSDSFISAFRIALQNASSGNLKSKDLANISQALKQQQGIIAMTPPTPQDFMIINQLEQYTTNMLKAFNTNSSTYTLRQFQGSLINILNRAIGEGIIQKEMDTIQNVLQRTIPLALAENLGATKTPSSMHSRNTTSKVDIYKEGGVNLTIEQTAWDTKSEWNVAFSVSGKWYPKLITKRLSELTTKDDISLGSHARLFDYSKKIFGTNPKMIFAIKNALVHSRTVDYRIITSNILSHYLVDILSGSGNKILNSDKNDLVTFLNINGHFIPVILILAAYMTDFEKRTLDPSGKKSSDIVYINNSRESVQKANAWITDNFGNENVKSLNLALQRNKNVDIALNKLAMDVKLNSKRLAIIAQTQLGIKLTK